MTDVNFSTSSYLGPFSKYFYVFQDSVLEPFTNKLNKDRYIITLDLYEKLITFNETNSRKIEGRGIYMVVF